MTSWLLSFCAPRPEAQMISDITFSTFGCFLGQSPSSALKKSLRLICYQAWRWELEPSAFLFTKVTSIQNNALCSRKTKRGSLFTSKDSHTLGGIFSWGHMQLSKSTVAGHHLAASFKAATWSNKGLVLFLKKQDHGGLLTMRINTPRPSFLV